MWCQASYSTVEPPWGQKGRHVGDKRLPLSAQLHNFIPYFITPNFGAIFVFSKIKKYHSTLFYSLCSGVMLIYDYILQCPDVFSSRIFNACN